MRNRAAAWAVLSGTMLAALPAGAQPVERFSVSSVMAADQFVFDGAVNRPNIVIDINVAVRLAEGWQVYVRPWFRQPRAATWDTEIYQAAVRYERPGPVMLRVDAGYIGSPVGLGMLETTPSVNPTILPHLTYFIPMPPFDATAPRVVPIASSYPLGAQVKLATERWDVRAALVSTAPTRVFVIGATSNPKPTPVVEGGAGITPVAGLRIGVSFAAGAWATPEETTRAGSRGMVLAAVEGEYAVRYTKLSGELVRTHFDTIASSADAYAWFIEGRQTLTPRWFAAARHEGTSAPPPLGGVVSPARMSLLMAEATLGFRVTPEIAVRGSYFARRFFGRAVWDQQAGASVVWAHRWW